MDPIADMLVTIKNGYLAGKTQVDFPSSKVKLAITKVLEKEKFVGPVTKSDSKITVDLTYENGKAKITEIKRISKLGLRVYKKIKNIKKVKGGRGIYIISTPQGVMSDKEAQSKKLGGEVICQVW